MKKILLVSVFACAVLMAGCSHRVEFEEQDIESGDVVQEDDAVLNLGMEESMDDEYVYFDDVEIVDPVIFDVVVEDGVMTPSEFYAKKGDYVLLRITNLSEEHAIVIDHYGWRTILHDDQETEFGFRANERGSFYFHCSQYCTQHDNHIKGLIVVE